MKTGGLLASRFLYRTSILGHVVLPGVILSTLVCNSIICEIDTTLRRKRRFAPLGVAVGQPSFFIDRAVLNPGQTACEQSHLTP